MLTKNEKKVLRLLMSSFDADYSINQIAKKCSLAPNGAYKILKKLEKEEILKSKNIANIKSYKIKFDNEKTPAVLELVLMPEVEGRVKHRLEDIKELRKITKSCIMFGSYIDLKKKPGDLDMLFVLDKKNYKKYKSKLNSIKDIIPAKVHDIIQTEEDLEKNIIKKDKVILDILQKGIVLWGQKIIVEVISNVYKR